MARDGQDDQEGHAEENGFSHPYADELSIGFVDAVLYEEDVDDEDMGEE